MQSEQRNNILIMQKEEEKKYIDDGKRDPSILHHTRNQKIIITKRNAYLYESRPRFMDL